MNMDSLTGNQYLIRKKFFKILGADFFVYDSAGHPLMFAHLKAFKLREDITLYTDETKTQPVIQIKARNIVDFSAAYDFYDAQTQRKLGAVKRKGWKSILRDEWIIMDIFDNEIGVLREDSGWLAFVRRFITNLIPETFHVTMQGRQIATYKNNFNPFIRKVHLTIHQQTAEYTTGFAIAMGILLCAIEGKQR